MNRHALFRIGSFGLIALIIGVGVMFGFLPRLAEIDANNAQLAEVQAQLRVEEADLGKIISLTENKPIAEAELAAYSLALPKDLAISDFVKSMHEISNKHSLDITTFSVGDPRDFVAPEYIEKDAAVSGALGIVNGGNLQTINVDLSVAGNQTSLIGFLQDVQSMQRSNLVYNVSLSNRTETGDSLLAISFEIFILK